MHPKTFINNVRLSSTRLDVEGLAECLIHAEEIESDTTEDDILIIDPRLRRIMNDLDLNLKRLQMFRDPNAIDRQIRVCAAIADNLMAHVNDENPVGIGYDYHMDNITIGNFRSSYARAKIVEKDMDSE